MPTTEASSRPRSVKVSVTLSNPASWRSWAGRGCQRAETFCSVPVNGSGHWMQMDADGCRDGRPDGCQETDRPRTQPLGEEGHVKRGPPEEGHCGSCDQVARVGVPCRGDRGLARRMYRFQSGHRNHIPTFSASTHLPVGVQPFAVGTWSVSSSSSRKPGTCAGERDGATGTLAVAWVWRTRPEQVCADQEEMIAVAHAWMRNNRHQQPVEVAVAIGRLLEPASAD